MSKFTVTSAPAGTVMVLLSKAMFWAVRSTVAVPPPGAVVAPVVAFVAAVVVVAAVVSAVVGVSAAVVAVAAGVSAVVVPVAAGVSATVVAVTAGVSVPVGGAVGWVTFSPGVVHPAARTPALTTRSATMRITLGLMGETITHPIFKYCPPPGSPVPEAERVAAVEIAVSDVGPDPAPGTADLLPVAGAARAPGTCLALPERRKHLVAGVAPYLAKRPVSYVAREKLPELRKLAGVDVPGGVDIRHPPPGAASAHAGKEAVCPVVCRMRIRFQHLKQADAVLGSIDGQELHRRRIGPEGLAVDQIDDSLHLPWPDLQVGVCVAPPPARDEPVDAEPVHPDRPGKRDQAPEFTVVPLRDREPDAAPEARIDAVLQRLHRTVETSHHSPEQVVGCRRRAVEGYTGIPNPGIPEPSGDGWCDQCPVGAQDRGDAALLSVRREAPEVFPHQRFPAGEEEERDVRRSKVVDERFCLACRQFILPPPAGPGPEVAVRTGEVAPRCDVPEDHRPAAPLLKRKVAMLRRRAADRPFPVYEVREPDHSSPLLCEER